MKTIKIYQVLLLIVLMIVSFSCGEDEKITVLESNKTIEGSNLDGLEGTRIQSNNCSLNGISSGTDQVAPGTSKVYTYSMSYFGISRPNVEIDSWDIVGGSDFSITRVSDKSIRITFGADFCGGQILVHGEEPSTNTTCDVPFIITALSEAECDIDPRKPTFAVETSGSFEVCPGEIFDAYSTEIVGQGFVRHEWQFPTHVIQLLPGYSVFQSQVKFRVVGIPTNAFFIKLKAHYRCEAVDPCSGTPEVKTETRTSDTYGASVQNCTGGPKI